MTHPKLSLELKKFVKSAIMPEFVGIDQLSDNPTGLYTI